MTDTKLIDLETNSKDQRTKSLKGMVVQIMLILGSGLQTTMGSACPPGRTGSYTKQMWPTTTTTN